MKNKILALILVLLSLVTLGGCGDKKDTKTQGTKKIDEVSIVLDWYPNAIHSFLYAGIKEGYYEKEGIKLKILFPSGTTDAITMTAANKVDIGIYYPGDLIKARANEQIPVKSIGAVVQEPLNVIISKKSQNIKRPKDLEGKLIGTSGDVAAEKIIHYLIEKDGGDVSKVQMVNVGFDLMSAITTDQVAATTGNMINHEVPALKDAGLDIDVMKPNDFSVPSWYEMLFISSEETISKKKDALDRFMRATLKGFEYMKNNKDKALDILLENQQKAEFPLKKSVEVESMNILIPAMQKKGEKFLMQDEKVWKDLIKFYKKIGIINKEIPAKEVYTNEFVK